MEIKLRRVIIDGSTQWELIVILDGVEEAHEIGYRDFIMGLLEYWF